jgi:hypothetical protein
VLRRHESRVQLVNMLSTIGARPAAGGEAELGAGIAGGELPHAQVRSSSLDMVDFMNRLGMRMRGNHKPLQMVLS